MKSTSLSKSEETVKVIKRDTREEKITYLCVIVICCRNFIAVWHATAHNSWILNHFSVQTHLIELVYLAADVLRTFNCVGLQKFNFTHCNHKDMMVQETFNWSHNTPGYWWSLDKIEKKKKIILICSNRHGSYTLVGV